MNKELDVCIKAKTLEMPKQIHKQEKKDKGILSFDSKSPVAFRSVWQIEMHSAHAHTIKQAAFI